MSQSKQIKQSERLLRIESPLGEDALVLRRLRVREAISTPFLIEAEVLSQNEDLGPGDLVGKEIACVVQMQSVPSRRFHGVVRSFGRTGALGRGYTVYRLEAVPYLWNLSRTADCRIFQEKTALDILRTLLSEGGVQPYEIREGGRPPAKPRPYVVQYNETDLAFLERLIAEIGFGYCFRPGGGPHETLFCGGADSWPNVPGGTYLVHPTDTRLDVLGSWQPAGRLPPAAAVSWDTDLLKLKGAKRTRSSSTLPYAGDASKWEIYLAPGGQAAQDDTDPARLLMEAAEAEAERFTTSSTDPNLFAGGKMKVDTGAGGGTFLITEILHEAYDETQLAQGGKDDYRSSLTVMKADRPWRPSRPRARPAMPGLQRAVVTGPAGEEIHTDQHGRIKIQFLWDRYGKNDENSSCWVRVLQPMAGRWGGTWFLPRLGDEVLVGFIDGEADRPVVVGSLYNAEAPPLWPLPGEKTKTGIRTRSSKGGGGDNFNMISLDDRKGAEHFEVQAEKDLTILVKNDRTETIRRHRTETVDGKHTATVKDDFSTTVTQGNHALQVKMGHIGTKADMGDISTKASLGKIEMEAMQSITLKVGQSKLTVDQTGITLEGMMITAKAQLMLQTEAGAMATHKGSAMLTIKGGIVMIN